MLRTVIFALIVASAASADSVPVADFARQHRLHATRDAATGRDILKGNSTVIVAPGFALALVDGRAVELSEPVRVENGRSVMSEEDAESLSRLVCDGCDDPEPASHPAAVEPRVPIPLPKKTAPLVKTHAAPLAGGRFKVIVLDPGHGGVHTGGKGGRGTMEKDINLEVAKDLRERLEAEGIKVVMTRDSDTQLSTEVREDLRRRVDFTNRTDPDLFLSIHTNWAENRGAEGFEVYYPRADCAAGGADRSKGRQVAEEIREKFAARFDTPDRGVKEAGYYVIKNANCPAVLVELEFVSSPGMETKLRESPYRKKLADALADAVLEVHRR